MIPTKFRDSRRKPVKWSKNIERLYKATKCRECSVVVTQMNFAKILGKFTKVKIQYENSNHSKSKLNNTVQDSKTKKENGIVRGSRKTFHERSALGLDSKESLRSNVLKENNRLKKQPVNKQNYSSNKNISTNVKRYSIIFVDPSGNNNNDIKTKVCLSELLPDIDNSILPSEEWCIEYFPKDIEPKDDKVYDRIAAELEDLMNSGRPLVKSDDKITPKNDEFPSIMDILNDTTQDQTCSSQSSSIFKSSLESTDVEAMLLGKSEDNKSTEITSMDVDCSEAKTIISEDNSNTGQDISTTDVKSQEIKSENEIDLENPHSPSILDETLKKGMEEHIPPEPLQNTDLTETTNNNITKVKDEVSPEFPEVNKEKEKSIFAAKAATITELVFKKTKNGKCSKCVTCPKNLRYKVDINSKSVEFLGAPKYVSSLEDLKVLLQIVNETELENLYVLH